MNLEKFYINIMKNKKREIKGLKKLRRASGKVPTYQCENCSCSRYSPCSCRRIRAKEVENQDTPTS